MVNLFLAFRYLSGKERKGVFSIFTIISILSIILGIAALIAVTTVMNGFQDHTIEKTIALQSFHITVASPFNEPLKDYDKLIQKIKENSHVIAAFPVIEKPLLYSAHGESDTAAIRAFGKEYFKTDFFKKNIKIVKGTVDFNSDFLMVGKEFGTLRNLYINNDIGLFGVTQKKLIAPKFKGMRINALFNTGFYPVDSGIFYTNIEVAQYLFNMEDSCSQIAVILDDQKYLHKVYEDLEDRLGFEYDVRTWADYNRTLYEAFKNEKTLMIFVVFMIIIVAAFNMISSQIMIVMNKRKEIGILKAIGFNPNDIKRIFIFYGSAIGIVGCSLGLILGLLISKNLDAIFAAIEWLVNSGLHFFYNIINIFNDQAMPPRFQIFSKEIYYFEKVPAKTNFIEVFFTIIFSMLLVFFSSYIPAKKASEVKPQEVIHNE